MTDEPYQPELVSQEGFECLHGGGRWRGNKCYGHPEPLPHGGGYRFVATVAEPSDSVAIGLRLLVPHRRADY